MSEETSTTTPVSWDVIVIGSGMGGMVTAAALSRVGHKVLLLEQYSSLGGQTHSFSRDGFSWDVGIHYLGKMGAPEQREKAILDWLTDTPIEFAPMGAVYDTLHIGDAQPLQLSRPAEAQKLDLKERFPEEGDAIDAWYNAIHDGGEARAGVTVESLLFDDDCVVGVATTDGEELYADKVVSDIGARETVDRLLPNSARSAFDASASVALN